MEIIFLMINNKRKEEFMSNFEKKNIIKEAENILEEYTKKDIEEKRKISELKNNYKKIKKVNLTLKILVVIMALAIFVMLV